MSNNLTAKQKYDYIKNKYGKDADRILKQFGAYAYDIDKAISVEAERLGKEKHKDYFQKRWEKQFRKGDYRISGAHLLMNNGVLKVGHSSEAFRALDAAAKNYKQYAAAKEKAAEDARKIKYIKDKYKDKADAILQKYGAYAYDIDKNFDKYYNKAVFFGRNYWMDQKGRQERSDQGRKNRELFTEGKLPLDEAARIINCPAYFGTLDMTIQRFKKEMQQSAASYKTQIKKKTTPSQVRHKVNPKPAQEQTQPKAPTKKQDKKRDATKREMHNQRTISETKSAIQKNSLDEIIVIGSAPKAAPITSPFDVKLAKLKASQAKIEIKSPEERLPEERLYEQLIAQKAADMSGKSAPQEKAEIGLTIGDLMKLGVDPIKDFQEIIKGVAAQDRAKAEKLIPAEGFGNEDVIVPKELALESIKRVQARSTLKELKKNKVRS